jgi:hypothetical protein
MIFFWRAIYGLIPLAAFTVLFVYRVRWMDAVAHGRAQPGMKRPEWVSLAIIFSWIALDWTIVHWQLWPALSH